jgi:integrase
MEAKITAKMLAALKPKKTAYEVCDNDVAGFRLRVQPSGKMSYYAVMRVCGARNRVRIGDARILNPQDARDRAKVILAGVIKGENPVAARKKSRAANLGEFIEGDYTRLWLAGRKSGDATLKRLRGCFKTEFWKRHLDDPKLGFAIVNWQARRLKEGTKAATVSRDIGALKAAFSKAVEWKAIAANPLAAWKPTKEDRARKVRYLTPEEEVRLMNALSVHDELLREGRDQFNAWRAERGYHLYPNLRKVPYPGSLTPLVVLSLNTGLRRGEAFNLTWQDVDLDAGMLTVEGGGAKSGTTRHVPLNSTALAALKGWRDSQQTLAKYVFPGKDGGRLDNVRKPWAAVLKSAGITGFRWHDQRHHFASRLVMAGVDLNTVRELLGHSDLKMTIRYAHLAPQMKARAVELLVARESNLIAFPKAGAVDK